MATSAEVDGASIAANVERGMQSVMSRFGLTRAQAEKICTRLNTPAADRLTEVEPLVLGTDLR